MNKQLLIALGALLSASCLSLQAIPTSELRALLTEDIERDNKRNEAAISDFLERNDEVIRCANAWQDDPKIRSRANRMASAKPLVFKPNPLVENPQALAELKQIAKEDADWLIKNKDEVIYFGSFQQAVGILSDAKIMLIKLQE